MRMKKLSKEQYDQAIAYDITKDFITVHENPVDDYPWVTFEIEERAIDVLSVILAKKDGYTEEDLQKNDALKRRYITLADRDIRQNGYQIHSTINKDIYDAMQQVVADYSLLMEVTERKKSQTLKQAKPNQFQILWKLEPF